MDWIQLVQDKDEWRALVDTVTNFGLHRGGVGIFLPSWATVSFSRMSVFHGVIYLDGYLDSSAS
jgi:hypothetical protein